MNTSPAGKLLRRTDGDVRCLPGAHHQTDDLDFASKPAPDIVVERIQDKLMGKRKIFLSG
jgi:hypothetical protein